ncbi:hypothetical protein KI387_002017, partial [Taxus chinensis]
RDTIQAASNFAIRNPLPLRLQDQMLSHICLKFRTEGMQRQETLDDLPKAIRSSIAQYLFFSFVEKVYLFRGVSNDFLFQLVSEMKAEYFPPKEDVILQNEAPTDFYVLVSGSVHLKESKDTTFNELATEMEWLISRGRVDVPISLCFVSSRGDAQIMEQLLNRGMDPNETDYSSRTPLMRMAVFLYGEAILGRHESVAKLLSESGACLYSSTGNFLCIAAEKGSLEILNDLFQYGADPNSISRDGRTALHVAVSDGNLEVVKFLLQSGSDMNKTDSNGWTSKALAEQQGHDEISAFFQEAESAGFEFHTLKKNLFSQSHANQDENIGIDNLPGHMEKAKMPLVKDSTSSTPVLNQRRKRTHNLENTLFGIIARNSNNNITDGSMNNGEKKRSRLNPCTSPRVTIHTHHPKSKKSSGQTGKLIMLPDSLEDLLKVA